MSPLDDARRLVESNSECANRLCHYCGSPGKLRGTEGSCHAPDCPWLAMPRIVAALEDHERCARSAAQVDAALKLARVDLDADEWPDGLAACDVIDKYLVSPAVRYIDELESELERLKGETPRGD